MASAADQDGLGLDKITWTINLGFQTCSVSCLNCLHLQVEEKWPPKSAALAKNKDRKDPIGFSRKAKAKRMLFLIFRLKLIAAHDNCPRG
jgi:hypothetical protein